MILQPWVTKLGLRHQGALLSCVRGCDGIGKKDPSKALIRAMRDWYLVSFNEKPSSFIDKVSDFELGIRMEAFTNNFDHYPIHFVLHLMQGAAIIGYKRPSDIWRIFYYTMCHRMHVDPETCNALDARLGACEEEFAKS